MLHVARRGETGDGDGEAHWPDDPVILLHGFTQTGSTWASVTEALVHPAGASAAHSVVTVDSPGHGRSGDGSADLWRAAELIRHAAGAGTYVGYSMGARLALHVALSHPGEVRRLVLVSGTAGIEEATKRGERRIADEQVARRIERDGVEAFLRWWIERPIFSGLDPTAALLGSRSGSSAAGLAASLRNTGAGTQEPLWDRLGEISVPTLVVAGELDPTYVAYGQRTVEAIGAGASMEVIADSGHVCPLEQPARFVEVLRSWLDRSG